MGEMAELYEAQQYNESQPYSEWNPRGFKKARTHMDNQPKEYTVKTWQAWEDKENDDVIRDKFGNYKGSVTFEEYNSEPVDATFKEQPKVGDKKFGTVEEYTTSKGSTRLKFQRANRPEMETKSQGSTAPKKDWQPRDDAHIKAQWAIGQAMTEFTSIPYDIRRTMADNMSAVEYRAKELFAMVDRVKDSTIEASTPAPQVQAEDSTRIEDEPAYKRVFGTEPLPEYRG